MLLDLSLYRWYIFFIRAELLVRRLNRENWEVVHILCAYCHLCGLGHRGMKSQLIVE